ncbi:MAG: hypothetical protein R3B47_15725 [Bacteroidia bacterium]
MKNVKTTLSLLYLIGTLLFVTACGEKKDTGPDLSAIDLEAPVIRIDLAMAEAARELSPGAGVAEYMDVYEKHLRPYRDPLYFIGGVDMIDLQRIRVGVDSLTDGQRDSATAFRLGGLLADSAMRQLVDSVAKIYPAGEELRARLEPVMKRYHYYFPEVHVPVLYTHLNGYDPSGNPAAIDQFFPGPGFLSIGLHYFMGKNFSWYSPNIPKYIKQRFRPEYLDVMLAHELASGTVQPLDPASQTSLLEAMVQQGIQHFVTEKLLPLAPDSMIMLYSDVEMAWALNFEQALFKDVAQQMFESDMMVKRKMLGENAFTSSYSEDSAPRIGAFLGWRIVQAYMENNPGVSLYDLVQETDFEKIYRESKYKP